MQWIGLVTAAFKVLMLRLTLAQLRSRLFCWSSRISYGPDRFVINTIDWRLRWTSLKILTTNLVAIFSCWHVLIIRRQAESNQAANEDRGLPFIEWTVHSSAKFFITTGSDTSPAEWWSPECTRPRSPNMSAEKADRSIARQLIDNTVHSCDVSIHQSPLPMRAFIYASVSW